jgi:hypothetical protein
MSTIHKPVSESTEIEPPRFADSAMLLSWATKAANAVDSCALPHAMRSCCRPALLAPGHGGIAIAAAAPNVSVPSSALAALAVSCTQ